MSFESNDSVRRVKDEVDKSGKSYLREFIHANEKFSINVLRIDPIDSEPGKYRTGFSIIDSDGQELATISGVVDSSKKSFVSFSSKNKGYEEISKHVPGLVSAAISEMVATRVFDAWFSSKGLTEGGHKLYGKIGSDPRVKMIRTKEYDGEERYKLTPALD